MLKDGLFFTNPVVYQSAEVEEALCLGIAQVISEILPHIEKEIGSHPTESAHHVEEHSFLYLEERHLEIVALFPYRDEVQGQDDDEVVLAYPARRGKNIENRRAGSAYSRYTLIKVCRSFIPWQL